MTVRNIALLCLCGLALSACGSMSRTDRAAIGGALGAGTGAAVSGTVGGALIGAGVGAAAGALTH